MLLTSFLVIRLSVVYPSVYIFLSLAKVQSYSSSWLERVVHKSLISPLHYFGLTVLFFLFSFLARSIGSILSKLFKTSQVDRYQSVEMQHTKRNQDFIWIRAVQKYLNSPLNNYYPLLFFILRFLCPEWNTIHATNLNFTYS